MFCCRCQNTELNSFFPEENLGNHHTQMVHAVFNRIVLFFRSFNSYVWEKLNIGYIQGMCDLCAPLLVIMDDGQYSWRYRYYSLFSVSFCQPKFRSESVFMFYKRYISFYYMHQKRKYIHALSN